MRKKKGERISICPRVQSYHLYFCKAMRKGKEERIMARTRVKKNEGKRESLSPDIKPISSCWREGGSYNVWAGAGAVISRNHYFRHFRFTPNFKLPTFLPLNRQRKSFYRIANTVWVVSMNGEDLKQGQVWIIEQMRFRPTDQETDTSSYRGARIWWRSIAISKPQRYEG